MNNFMERLQEAANTPVIFQTPMHKATLAFGFLLLFFTLLAIAIIAIVIYNHLSSRWNQP